MIDTAMWAKAMALLDSRDAQCNQLITIVKERDAYLEKAVALIEERDSALTQTQQDIRSLMHMLKEIAANPDLLRRPEYQAVIATLPSTH